MERSYSDYIDMIEKVEEVEQVVITDSKCDTIELS